MVLPRPVRFFSASSNHKVMSSNNALSTTGVDPALIPPIPGEVVAISDVQRDENIISYPKRSNSREQIEGSNAKENAVDLHSEAGSGSGADVASHSNYTWNSDDEPPNEGKGEEYYCTYDKFVTRMIVAPPPSDVSQV